MKRYLIVLTFIQAFAITVPGQDHFPNTLSFDEELGSPKATLEDIEWLSGRWTGEAFGGTTEELWSPPSGHSMMGAFKLVVDGKANFYEIVTITEEDETLLLRLKHFHSNLKGWEEKDVTRDFKLVKVTPTRVYFDGYTFEKNSANSMTAYVVVGARDGSQTEEMFPYKRVGL